MIKIYLDSSDYQNMHAGKQEAVKRFLLEKVASREIAIGVSYTQIFELFQPAAPEKLSDRIATAKLLKELCGTNAFPYPGDLKLGHDFSDDGVWYPRECLAEFDIESLTQRLIREVTQLAPDRATRRRLANRSFFIKQVRENRNLLETSNISDWPLPFGRELVEKGILRKYLLKEITKKAANKILHNNLSDFETIYLSWFEHYNKENPLTKCARDLSKTISECITTIGKIVHSYETELSELARAVDTYLPDTNHKSKPRLKNITKKDCFWRKVKEEASARLAVGFGKLSADVAVEIIIAFYREKGRIKGSDGGDFMHAMYLPYADLWRGDKAFSNLLIKHKVIHSEKVVARLCELPARIHMAAESAALKAVRR